MVEPASPEASALLARLGMMMRAEPNNIPEFCAVGDALAALGRDSDVEKCYQAALQAMLRAAAEREADAALDGEARIYLSFVTRHESEENYERRFSDWRRAFVRLGRQYRKNVVRSEYDPRRVAFVLHSGHLLGHTHVLFRLLEGLKALPETGWTVRIYVLADVAAPFLQRAREIGVEIVRVSEASPDSLLQRFLWLREDLRANRFGVCVWVTAPVWCAFAFAMRLAPTQVFWALRFHPDCGPDVDGYVSWGAPGEQTRRYGSNEWRVVPMSLAIEEPPPSEDAILQARGLFPEKLLFGTLAREEKINSPDYLKAVADILRANPEAGFLWTGRKELVEISSSFRAAGVADRCHFIGWVDTNLYAAVIDVFLETFPIGSGVTSLQTLAAGTPLVSLLHPESIFGTYYWDLVKSRAAAERHDDKSWLASPEEFPILCGRDIAEYVALAGRLASDAGWRKAVGTRGRAFHMEELRNNSAYAKQFVGTISAFTAAKFGGHAAPA